MSSRFMLCSDTGKAVHFTRASAQRLSNKKGGMVVYQCNHCKYWHTAKSAKAKRRANEQRAGRDTASS